MSKPRALPAPAALAPPAPGDFCCVPISGGAGLGIEIGQWLDGDKFQPYDHAEIFVGQADAAGPHGYTVSAYPDRNGRRPLPCPPAQLPGSLWSSGLIALADAERQAIIAWAMDHQQVKYSFADYGALALHHWHLDLPWLQSYIGSTKRLICSQFVDAAYAAAAVHLFQDQRWGGYVKPGDLAGMLQDLAAQAR
jgi:hypothetical protein